MRRMLKLLALAAALLLGAAPAMAQTFPPFTGLVVDAANVLPPATEAGLTAKLEALQKDTRRQLVVATIPDLHGQETPEYGVALFRAWHPGLKDVDNGAILFIAPNEPKGHRGPRLAVGYGLEPILTDAFAGTVIRERMMPKLIQSGDIPGAMEAGTDAIIAQLRASPEEAKANVDAAAAAFDRTHQRSRQGGRGGFPVGLIFWGVFLAFVLLSVARRGGGGGRRYRSGGDGLAPVILWGLANELGRHSGGSGSAWSGGGGGWSGGGGSDGSWGGGGFTGGGGGDTGGGGASGSW